MNATENFSMSSSSKSIEVLYALMHLNLTSVVTLTLVLANPPLPLGKEGSTQSLADSPGGGGAQLDRNGAWSDSDAIDAATYHGLTTIDLSLVPTKDCNGSGTKSSDRVLLALLGEDFLFEKLIFFFTTD